MVNLESVLIYIIYRKTSVVRPWLCIRYKATPGLISDIRPLFYTVATCIKCFIKERLVLWRISDHWLIKSYQFDFSKKPSGLISYRILSNRGFTLRPDFDFYFPLHTKKLLCVYISDHATTLISEDTLWLILNY